MTDSTRAVIAAYDHVWSRLTARLVGLRDEEYFWMYGRDNTFDLALHVMDELIHHGAEVGLLRDLYGQGAPSA